MCWVQLTRTVCIEFSLSTVCFVLNHLMTRVRIFCISCVQTKTKENAARKVSRTQVLIIEDCTRCTWLIMSKTYFCLFNNWFSGTWYQTVYQGLIVKIYYSNKPPNPTLKSIFFEKMVTLQFCTGLFRSTMCGNKFWINFTRIMFWYHLWLKCRL